MTPLGNNSTSPRDIDNDSAKLKEPEKQYLREQKSLGTQGENTTLHGTDLSNVKAQKEDGQKVLC